jgi:hypothetical protein
MLMFALAAVLLIAFVAYTLYKPTSSFTGSRSRLSESDGHLMPSLANHRAFVEKVGPGAGTFPSLTTEYPALMTRFASSAPGREGRSDNPALGSRVGNWYDPREDQSIRHVRGPQIRAAHREKRFVPEMMFNIGEDFYDHL